jgi:hypothetical protein
MVGASQAEIGSGTAKVKRVAMLRGFGVESLWMWVKQG